MHYCYHQFNPVGKGSWIYHGHIRGGKDDQNARQWIKSQYELSDGGQYQYNDTTLLIREECESATNLWPIQTVVNQIQLDQVNGRRLSVRNFLGSDHGSDLYMQGYEDARWNKIKQDTHEFYLMGYRDAEGDLDIQDTFG